MYNDNASEAPLYLVSNIDGTGKRLIRRPHPPPTTAPLPDDFDAITETRDSTTIYDEAANSALDIDYDAITIAPATPRPSSPSQAQTPIPIRAPLPLFPHRTGPTSPPRHPRAASPSHSLASLNLNLTLSPDARRSGSVSRHGDGPNPGKARSVAGAGDRDRDRATQRRSLGTGNPPPSGKGPAKGRGELVEKLVLEDGPERTISFWRESVAKDANGHAPAVTGGAGTGTGTGGGGGGGGGDAGGDGDGRSDLDSHVGRRRVSTDSRRRVESLVQGSTSAKSKGHRSRESADFTEVPHSPLQPTAPTTTRSGTPHANTASQPTTPQKSTQRRAAPSSPSVGPKATECSSSVSDATSHTKVAPASAPVPVPAPAPAPVSHGTNHQLESVLSSCQPSLLHLLPILEELGVRGTEHMTALVRMREEIRDREVKEEALRKGITVIEWAIFIDKLQSL